MAVKKSRFIGKILTGILTTIIAPAVASIVAQQVTEWQDTVKYAVENRLPALSAEWNQPVAADNARRLEATSAKRPKTPPAALLPPVGKITDHRQANSCGQ